MENKSILIEMKKNIMLIIFNNKEKMNILDDLTLSELDYALSKAEENDDVKGVIISSAKSNVFLVGANIKKFADFTPKQGLMMGINGQKVFARIENMPKPVLAAVNGYVLGGGCELTIACHLAVASENSSFSQPEVKLGIIPGYGGTQRLTKLLGKSKALELMMTGEMISALEAEKLGLVNYVVPQEELLSKSIQLMERIISNSMSAVKGIIRSVNAFYQYDQDGYLIEQEEFERCFADNDFKEGTAAFLEKRNPVF